MTSDELDSIEETYLKDVYPNGISATGINNFFWFEKDFIAELLGYEDFEDMYDKRTKITT